MLFDCGLVIERERTDSRTLDRYYDRFRDRLMFPIRDSRGRVLAFGGRIIDQGEPKYLNSPETLLFHKGRELYGLYEVRQSRTTLKRLLVVEGYMDVARLHQAGVNYAVATLGTATTPEHLRRIFKLVNEVVFCFDGDKAGRAAAWRALGNALPEARDGRQIRFLFLPEGHDPDSLVGEEGREAFEKRLDGALPLSEYLAAALAEQADLSHADGRAQFAELARPLVTKVAPGVYRDLLIERLAESIKLSSARLNQLWFNEVTDNRGQSPRRRQPGDRGRPAVQRARPPCLTRPRDGGGGKGLVTKAVKLLVHFPRWRRRITGAQLTPARDDRRRRLALPVRAHRPAPAGTGRAHRRAARALARPSGGGAHAGAGGRRKCWASKRPRRRSNWPRPLRRWPWNRPCAGTRNSSPRASSPKTNEPSSRS